MSVNDDDFDANTHTVQLNMTSSSEQPISMDPSSEESRSVQIYAEAITTTESVDTISVTYSTVSYTKEVEEITIQQSHDDQESVDSNPSLSSDVINQSYKVEEETSTSFETNGGVKGQEEEGEIRDEDDDGDIVYESETLSEDHAGVTAYNVSMGFSTGVDEEGLNCYEEHQKKNEEEETVDYNGNTVRYEEGEEQEEAADVTHEPGDDYMQVKDNTQANEYLVVETASYCIGVSSEQDATDNAPQVSSYSTAPAPTSPNVNEMNPNTAQGKQKESATSGKFVLRNARHEDARHFVQHIRQMASNRSALSPSEREKVELFTILRSTNKEDLDASQKKNQLDLQSSVTNNLVHQFEKNSVGGSAVFPSSKNQPPYAGARSISIDTLESSQLTTEPLNFGASKQRAELSKKGSLANRRRPSRASVISTSGQQDDNDTTNVSDRSEVVSPVIVSPTVPKTNESLARELEEKIKIKALLREKVEQQVKEQEQLLKTQNDGKSLFVMKSQSEDGEPTVRPSQLVQKTVSGGANEGTIPSWQLALREKNKSKRESIGGEKPRNTSVTSPTGDSPQTTPLWVVEVERRKLRLSSSTEPEKTEVTGQNGIVIR